MAERAEQPYSALPESKKRPAFYALAPGGWRDYWTLLHPPYTAWLLAHVAFGAAVAPVFSTVRFAATLLAFFLAVGLGILGAVKASAWLIPFIGFGVFIAVVYNLELFGGRLHTEGWFTAAWGAFPVITAYFAQAETIKPSAVLVAVACLLLASVQRTLSPPVTRLRRKALHVSGEVCYADGSTQRIDETWLRAAPEKALCRLAIALAILAAGLVAFRFA